MSTHCRLISSQVVTVSLLVSHTWWFYWSTETFVEPNKIQWYRKQGLLWKPRWLWPPSNWTLSQSPLEGGQSYPYWPK